MFPWGLLCPSKVYGYNIFIAYIMVSYHGRGRMWKWFYRCPTTIDFYIQDLPATPVRNLFRVHRVSLTNSVSYIILHPKIDLDVFPTHKRKIFLNVTKGGLSMVLQNILPLSRLGWAAVRSRHLEPCWHSGALVLYSHPFFSCSTVHFCLLNSSLVVVKCSAAPDTLSSLCTVLVQCYFFFTDSWFIFTSLQ
jgi:hypothetical protein